MSSTMLYLHTLSPLHCGIGQGSGIIDLPVVRDITTGWPEVPGSGIKGVLRDSCREANVDAKILKVVFGPNPDDEDASDNAGGLWSASARLVCFPVRSFRGTFAWITCPLALNRWRRDCLTIGQSINLSIPAPNDDESLITSTNAAGTLGVMNGDASTVLLEDFDLTADISHAESVADIGGKIAKLIFPGDQNWQDFFNNRFGIVSDDLFGFLTATATEVRARVRIDDKRKIVADGQLWYEETVPMETIFAMPLRSTPQGEKRLEKEEGHAYARQVDVVSDGIQHPIQLGGNASVGYGIAWARLDLANQAAGNNDQESQS